MPRKRVSENSLKNLVQNREDFTPEQVREFCSRAGKASGARRHREKLQRDILRELMVLECDDDQIVDELTKLGLEPTFAHAMNLAVLRKALRGDVESARYVRDTMGEKPTENMNLGVFNTPTKALDMTKLSDAELEALADRADSDDD